MFAISFALLFPRNFICIFAVAIHCSWIILACCCSRTTCGKWKGGKHAKPFANFAAIQTPLQFNFNSYSYAHTHTCIRCARTSNQSRLLTPARRCPWLPLLYFPLPLSLLFSISLSLCLSWSFYGFPASSSASLTQPKCCLPLLDDVIAARGKFVVQFAVDSQCVSHLYLYLCICICIYVSASTNISAYHTSAFCGLQLAGPLSQRPRGLRLCGRLAGQCTQDN